MHRHLVDHLGLKKHHHPIDLLADVSALLSGVALFPQLYRLLTTRDGSVLSLTTFLMIFTANIIWLLYGIHRRSLPLIVTAILVLCSAGPIVALLLFWK